MSFDIILPFLRPIAHLIEDPDVSEIMVNGSSRIFVEREGVVREVIGAGLDERNLRAAVKNIARTLGDDVSEEKPILDSRLPDGSRVAAILPPCSLGGTTLTIRKFQARFFTADELVRIGTMTNESVAAVKEAIAGNRNVLISGGTSTGKTTLLNALAVFLPIEDRVVLIEDTAELQIDRPNLVRFEARREQASLPAVTIRDLLRATLRHRPDRIIVGEVRGGEAFDLLQALNTGHAGSLSTIHASSAEQALARFASCVVQSGIDLPYRAVRHQIADAIDMVLHLGRHRGKRLVEEVVAVEGYEGQEDRYVLGVLHRQECA
jgi:pilus assembly protein CpaF